MAGYRYSNDLAYGDDYGYRGERWDRDRFERMRARSRGPRGSGTFQFEEDDYNRRGSERVRVEIDDGRRRDSRDYGYAPYGDDRYYATRRSRPEYLESDRYETYGREIAPYRPRYEYDSPSRPTARPGLVRRQTSLDTFDRRPIPRYDEERDVNVTLNVRGPDPVRYEPRDEDYRDVVIRRERERDVYRRRRSSSSSEEVIVPVIKPKRGKSRFPKRLCHLKAILDLGHPYEEDEHFYIVRVALSKSEIDTVLEKSKIYFSETTTKVTETKLIEAPVPPRSEINDAEPEIIETTTTKIIENPTAEEIARLENDALDKAASVAHSRRSRRSSSGSDTTLQQSERFDKNVAISVKSPSPTRHGRRGRSRSRQRGDEIFESNNSDSLTLVLPTREKSRSRRDIEEEIRRLELEKRAIRRERRYRDDYDRESSRDYEYEVVNNDVRVERGTMGELRFERDAPRRSKSSRRSRPTQRDVNAALFALT